MSASGRSCREMGLFVEIRGLDDRSSVWIATSFNEVICSRSS